MAARSAQPLDQLSNFLQGLTSFSADFEQALFNEYRQPLEVSQGQVQLMRDGRFRWRYVVPYAQQIINDGQRLWVYDADLQQVTINDVAASLANTPLMILTDQFDLSEHYRLDQRRLEAGAHIITLRPHDPESHYQAIHLGFEDDMLRFMVLHDALGHISEITFSNAVRNPAFDTADFAFNPPHGVDVIDNRSANPTQ